MSEDNESGCFRVFCTPEKERIGERIKQVVDEKATKEVLRTMFGSRTRGLDGFN